VSFRLRLLGLFTLTVVIVVALVTIVASFTIRRAFERADEQHTSALVAQFRSEFARRGEEVARNVEDIATHDPMQRIAVELSRPSPDYSPYSNEAEGLARSHQLDFLEIVASDGAIISSAQWPARFGYKDESWQRTPDVVSGAAFLKREDLPAGPVLALSAARQVRAAENPLYVIVGRKLDRDFLASMTLPTEMRAFLYFNNTPAFSADALIAAVGTLSQPQKLAPLIEVVRQQRGEASQTIDWTSDPADSESVRAIPLSGRKGELLAVLLVGSSRRSVVELERQIRSTAVLVGAGGLLLGILLSGWAANRVHKPVEQLAEAAREVAAGNLDVRVYVESRDELGQLGETFNRMARDLQEQRDRLVQAERVAAWRELARRLAHELKNPLFPLQITVENLVRARESNPDQFDEVFKESTATLSEELANMKTIIGRFSDFAKMPPPELQPLQLNDVVRQIGKLIEPQLARDGASPITLVSQLDPTLPIIQADRDLLYRALQNLALNAIDAMPQGGTLTLRTSWDARFVHLDVGDTGVGLERAECERLFTPYYTTKQHGTGLGLAIVQSVVSDHHGKITVDSAPGRGAIFHVELPVDDRVGEARGAHGE
jgi:two-component system nitrogen regulation sensor histidine kinase NtrY